MKKILYSLVLLLMVTLLLPINSYAKTKTPGEDYYNNAMKLYTSQKYQEAVDNFNLAIKANPKYQIAFKGKGMALLYLGQYEKAIEAYNTAINLNPKDAEAYVLKAGALKYLGKYADIITVSDMAIKINPKYVLAYFTKGEGLNVLGRYDEASACFNKAAALDPKFIDVNIGRGNTYLYKKEYDNAIKYYDSVLKVKPSYELALVNKGFALYFSQKYTEAVDCLNSAANRLPQFADIYYIISCSQSMLGDKENSIANLTKAISMNKACMILARIDYSFEYIAKDNRFIELVYDASDSIKSKFSNANIINEGALSGIKFLDIDTTGNSSEDAKILQIEKDLSISYCSGSIYNQNAISSYHLYKDSPFIKEFINYGRSYKAKALVGLKENYIQTEGKILYIGKLSGDVKAVVVKASGNMTIDGELNNYEDYDIFISSNGTWEYYGDFTLEEKDNQK